MTLLDKESDTPLFVVVIGSIFIIYSEAMHACVYVECPICTHTLIFCKLCNLSWGVGRYNEAVVLKNAARLLGVVADGTQNGTMGLKLNLVTQVRDQEMKR